MGECYLICQSIRDTLYQVLLRCNVIEVLQTHFVGKVHEIGQFCSRKNNLRGVHVKGFSEKEFILMVQ
jgi:hypothetical protein